ncbi:MAG TPA: BACON domain-containing carbohydrate-binding protein [Pyrinomonadaceae bacterium]
MGTLIIAASSSSCGYTSSSDVPWITTSYTGTGIMNISYTVQPNTGAARTGTITASVSPAEYVKITVSQAAGQSNCTYTLNPNSTLVTGGSGTAGFNVTTQSGCAWTANTFNSDWITITSGSSGVGNGTVNFSYTINTLNERRFGSIKVADQTFTLAQDRFCNLANMNSFAGASSNGGLVTVSHLINCTFTVTTDSSWITIPRPLDGPSFGVSFRVNPNPGPARTGTVTVKILNSTSPEETKTITVTQAGSCINSLSSIGINIGGSGGNNFGVSVSAPVNCSWEATTESSWIQITRSAGSGNGEITFTVAPNTVQARTGTIIINGQTFTVNQTTAECTYSLSPTSIQAGAAGGDTGFNITTETGCNWTAASNVNWITVSNTTGNGSGRVNYSVQPNSGQARTGTITAGNQIFTVNQDAVAAPVELIRASGRVVDANFKSVRGAIVSFTNIATGETRTTTTNQFGYFHFANIERGQPYSIAISHKRYKFTTRTVIYNTGALIPIYNPDPEP